MTDPSRDPPDIATSTTPTALADQHRPPRPGHREPLPRQRTNATGYFGEAAWRSSSTDRDAPTREAGAKRGERDAIEKDAASLRVASARNLSSLAKPRGNVVYAALGVDGVSPDGRDKEAAGDAGAGADEDEEGPTTGMQGGRRSRHGLVVAFRHTFWMVATYSWLNVLLLFVPIGIVVATVPGVHGGIVFAMNCIAVIPLAGLLSFATESVARNMGDALGALLNITFGNAVELIIFIALVKNQIRIVQASLLGSILANLLLILGMGFFLGGLRFREQIYNSTVTQMSACLLSLSVISLVLPTAFHASFSDLVLADRQSLKISRGTSVILLLVYIVYLLFQLKSHAYMYESTPQHIVDAESTPGPAAAWLDTSSSDSSSDASSESDSSDHSRDTVRRKVKKVLRAGRRRKSSAASTDTAETGVLRGSAPGTTLPSPTEEGVSETSSSPPHPTSSASPYQTSPETNEVTFEDEKPEKRGSRRHHRLHRHRRKHKKHRHHHDADNGRHLAAASYAGERADAVAKLTTAPTAAAATAAAANGRSVDEPRRVDFAVAQGPADNAGPGPAQPKRPFPNLRVMSVKNFAPAVFIQKSEPSGLPASTPSGPVPRVRYGIRRTNSLPDRLHMQHHLRPPGAMMPAQIPLSTLNEHGAAAAAAGGPDAGGAAGGDDDEHHLSCTASVILLLITTGLVAVCAEFLVGSIEAVTSTSTVGEVFIGLIILPIVGNAAEHVTAITVAMKNKMDLAIAVAVGSSIQIAIFVTPLVVILGWLIGRDMSLYFTLFETVSLFVSAFMVNFLVLDGRSNYLEGALLCAVYIIIAIVAFFYPENDQVSRFKP